MIRRWRGLMAALLLLSLLIAAVPAYAAPQPRTDVSAQAARVAAFKEIVAMVKAKTVDYDAVLAAYKQKLQATVKARDAENKIDVDLAIVAALTAGKSGQLPQGVVAQMVDKLLQRVFFLTIKHEFVEAKEHVKSNPQEALHEIDEAIAYFEALRGTVQKRDQAFGTSIEADIDTALSEAQKAVQAGDEESLYFLQPLVTHNLIRTFYLALTGYAKKVEDGAAAGNDVAADMAEGWSFYQSIKGNVGRRTPDLADFVEARLNPVQGDARLVKAAEIRAALSAGLAGYVIHEVEATFKEWEKVTRLHTAAEGAVIAQAVEAHLGEVLGAGAQAQYRDAITAFAAAARAKDRAAAEASGKVLADLSQQLIARLAAAPADTIQLTIGKGLVKARGKWIAADVAPFIENSRTLVPVRFVAEALGAQVEWLADSQTVKISLKGKTILLPVGKLQATVDGAAVTLDVAASIKGNRTFVPVRFVSEALGAQVDYDAATQTVLIK